MTLKPPRKFVIAKPEGQQDIDELLENITFPVSILTLVKIEPTDTEDPNVFFYGPFNL